MKKVLSWILRHGIIIFAITIAQWPLYFMIAHAVGYFDPPKEIRPPVQKPASAGFFIFSLGMVG